MDPGVGKGADAPASFWDAFGVRERRYPYAACEMRTVMYCGSAGIAMVKHSRKARVVGYWKGCRSDPYALPQHFESALPKEAELGVSAAQCIRAGCDSRACRNRALCGRCDDGLE
jgi:hypothetical protein